jgi:hypothetical protein
MCSDICLSYINMKYDLIWNTLGKSDTSESARLADFSLFRKEPATYTCTQVCTVHTGMVSQKRRYFIDLVECHCILEYSIFYSI